MSDLEREKFEARKLAFTVDLSNYHGLCLLANTPCDANAFNAGWLAHEARSESAPSDLRRAWEQGRDAAQEVAQHWAKSPSCANHSDNPCCHVRTGAGIAAKIGKLKWPGESATATPQMIDFAAQTVECKECGWTGQFRSIWEHFVSKHPALSEAGSPAPAPTEEK